MGESTIFQDSRGNQFEYYTYGSENGYPVLYMHGSVPMPFSKKLAEVVTKYNLYVIVILRPCYGVSSCQKYKNVFEYTLALNEMISHFGFKSFDVLGLSAGAPYCYAVAAAYPDLVDTVHICSGIPLANKLEIYRMNPWKDRFLFFLSRHIPVWLIGRYGVQAIEAQEKVKGWLDFDGESMDEVFCKYIRPNWMGIGQSTNLQYRDWGFAADTITKKICIYHSRADEAIPFEIARKSAEFFINSEFFVYESEDHGSEKIVEGAIIHIGQRVRSAMNFLNK